MKKTTIFTHVRTDIDAACSVWFFLRFVLKKTIKEVEIVFKPANWDGEGFGENDFALDISAGGRGIKGEFKKNRTSSCFMSLLNSNLDKVDREIKKHVVSLAKFVDRHDSGGHLSFKNFKVLDNERVDLADFRGLLKVFMGYHTSNSDYDVLLKFFENLNNHFNLIIESDEEKESLKEIDPDTKVALVVNKNIHSGPLFHQGKKIVIYVDGNNLGIVVGDFNLRSDKIVEVIKRLIDDVGEKIGDGGDNWFVDPGKRLICRGSRKSPVNTPSKVNPEKLYESLVSFVSEEEAKLFCR